MRSTFSAHHCDGQFSLENSSNSTNAFYSNFLNDIPDPGMIVKWKKKAQKGDQIK